MNVLLIGSGGREHAMGWAISSSPLLSKLYAAPGNGGLAEIAECVPLDVSDHRAVKRFCREKSIGLVAIGPETPLVAGLADDLRAARIKTFGPGKIAARLEGSKGYTKDLCAEYGVPTADYARFTDPAPAKAWARAFGGPVVVKADGLAAGKGVTVAESLAEAEAAIDACFSGAFGAAGAEVIVEERLMGEEASFFAIVDGETAVPLAAAQDHKRAFDGDQGPNTGGMGACSPAPVMTPELCRRTMDEIVLPTVRAMADRGAPFQGVLYAGLMITADGPKLIEYNVRFGDPEAQALLVRLRTDFLGLLLAACDGTLKDLDLRWSDDAALTVVLAAKGYPGAYETGTEILGLEAAAADPNVQIFHAGTKREGGRTLACGGRALSVTATGATMREARDRAYAAIARIDWPGGFWRRDIGWRAIEREERG